MLNCLNFFSTYSEGHRHRLGRRVYLLGVRATALTHHLYSVRDFTAARASPAVEASEIPGTSTRILTASLLDSAGPMEIADFSKDEQFASGTRGHSKKYNEYLPRMGTLANGGVYVAVSDLAYPKVMLGLFAGKEFAPGDPVVEYGGVLEDTRAARADEKHHHSHTMRVPDSDFVRNGKPFADHFPITGDAAVFYAEELKYAIKDRTKVEPVSDSERKNNYMRTMGLGFMANTNSVTNLKTERVKWRSDKLGPIRLILVASKRIKKDDELTLNYQLHVVRGD